MIDQGAYGAVRESRSREACARKKYLQAAILDGSSSLANEVGIFGNSLRPEHPP